MKRPGQTVKLRNNNTEPPLPERGDWLRTSTGRTYEVLEVSGQQLTCMVLRPDAKPAADCIIYEWVWNWRRR